MRTNSPSLPFGRPDKPKARPATKGVSASLFYGLFVALAGTNVLTFVGFMMSPDISNLMSGQAEVVLAAYEDRIAELRVEVDRLHSRQYAQTGDINLQLQELAQQQEVLAEQHQYVRLLAEKASALGIETAVAPADEEFDEDRVLITGSIASGKSPNEDIAAAELAMRQMMNDTQLALASITSAANESTNTILDELRVIGIQPKLPAADGIGGPFIDADDGPDALSLVDEANAVMDSLTRFKAARDAIDVAPVHFPMAGKKPRVSSGYGNRTDPFTRGKAFHAGLDFPAPTGTIVLSAGQGTVTFVGKRSGYGNVVEISHGADLITRYAHLSAFLVKEGQVVKTGTPIAKVGSTGRSTGPHLHFEVRRDDKTMDPKKFLAVGKELQHFFV